MGHPADPTTPVEYLVVPSNWFLDNSVVLKFELDQGRFLECFCDQAILLCGCRPIAPPD